MSAEADGIPVELLLNELRKPFAAEAVGKLPRTTCKRCSEAPSKVCNDHSKKECKTCGNYMTQAHIHLDYVGHAEVTDRLLSVDPLWAWEPLAFNDDGTPIIKKGVSGEWELWIRLTVLGITRIGVGSVSSGFDAEKQLIGDALRNAAMRFGVALDLWSKAELESALDETPLPAVAPAEADKLRRARIGVRAKALPEHGQQAFRNWLDQGQLSRVFAELTDAQVALAEEWLTNAESEVEHDAGEAGDGQNEPNPASDGPSAPVGASNAPGPSERLGLREAAAAAFVADLDAAQLLAEFGARNAIAPRRVSEQRAALAALLCEDAAWQPEPAVLA